MTLSALQKHSFRFRKVFPQPRPVLAAVLLSVLTTGCSAVDTVTNVFSEPLVLPCPEYRVIADAASLIRFRDGPGRDLTDVNFEGKIVDVLLGCTSNIDKKTRAGSMDIEVILLFSASRGPANKDRKAHFPYFIRILDKKDRILWGEDYNISIGFPGKKTRLQFRSQPLTLVVPIREGWNNRSYVIMAGIKLNREELKFNRARRAKTRK